MGNLDDAIKDGWMFYSAFLQNEHRPSPWTGDEPSLEELEAARAGQLFDMTIDGKRWRRVPLAVNWSLAEDDANYRSDKTKAKHKTTPRHLHCEFEFQQQMIHIDFVRYVTWGPLSGFQEFKFFVNGQLKSRGGYYALFGTHEQAMPACLRTNEYAIIADGRLDGLVLPGLSAWLIDTK